MQGDSPVSWLMFFTLAATVFIIAGAFIYFLRSRSNREIAAETLEGNGSRIGATPNGAGAELIGFGVLALVAMGLLATGYNSKSKTETAAMTTPVGGTSGMSQSGGGGSGGSGAGGSGMAQPVGTANQPKLYQPANPAPDTRSAPTSSDTGIGPENGSTGQPK